MLSAISDLRDRCVDVRSSADAVEKVAGSLFQFSRAKIDLSDRPTSRWRAPVKGKKTPSNFTKQIGGDFFNSIRRKTANPGASRGSHCTLAALSMNR